MVRHTDTDDGIAFDTHDDAVDAIQSGDVEAGDQITVEYRDVNGNDQTETGTITDTEVVEAGTVHGTEPRTWVTKNTFYRITYEVAGKNDHTVTGELGGDAPEIYTEVGGSLSHGGDRRTVGNATGVTVEPEVDEDDKDDAYERFTFPSWYAVQNEGAESAPDGFPEAGLLEGADDVRVGYLSNRTDNMVEVAIDVDEVVRHGDHSTDTYWFAGNPHGRDSDRYEVDFGTVTTRDSKGRLITVGKVRYVDVPADRVRTDGAGSTDRAVVTDGGSDVDPTPTECVWCGETHPRESLREAPDGLRCPKCYHEPDAEHADRDVDAEDVRHVVDDITPSIHLVTADDGDVALCGQMVVGLRPFGDAPASIDEAARLGAWVNVRDDMCPACRDVFNDAVFDR